MVQIVNNDIWSIEKYGLGWKQLQSIIKSTSRINLWEGAVRSGKTHSSIKRWVKYIGTAPDQGDLLMVGKTYGSLVRNVVRPMKELIGDDMVFYPSKNMVRLWGKTIYCYGASNSDSIGVIQGMTCCGCYGDEVSLWRLDFFQMMMTRLSVDGAKFFGTTNPDSPFHWLKVDYIDRADVVDIQTFHFEIDDNHTLGEEYKRALKTEYTGVFYKRFVLGLWVMAEGTIYDFYDDGGDYVIKNEEMPKPDYRLMGIDYGTQNPFVAIIFGVKNRPDPGEPKIWAEREWVYCGKDEGIQMTDSEYRVALEKWRGEDKIRSVYLDPSAASFQVECKKAGTGWRMKDVDNSVLDGIRTQAKMLKRGDYRVGEDCKFTRKEYSLYVWDEKAQKRGEDKPVKSSDHSKDPERYTLHTVFGKPTLDLRKLVS